MLREDDLTMNELLRLLFIGVLRKILDNSSCTMYNIKNAVNMPERMASCVRKSTEGKPCSPAFYSRLATFS